MRTGAPTRSPFSASPIPPHPYRRSGIPVRRGRKDVREWLVDGSHDSVHTLDLKLTASCPAEKLRKTTHVTTTDKSDSPERRSHNSHVTLWGVINFAKNTSEILSSSSFFLIILMLPSVLYFGFIHGFLATVATYIVSIWKLLYPADPSARRAYALRMVAQAAIILQLSLYLLGYRFPINTRLKWGGAWLVGALVIALLPIHYTILLGAPIRACSRIANHLRTHATYYILTIGGIGSGVGVYYLIVHVNGIVETDRHQMYDPFRLHKQILAELEELRAEVQALRQT